MEEDRKIWGNEVWENGVRMDTLFEELEDWLALE